jgi:hypothetical protein
VVVESLNFIIWLLISYLALLLVSLIHEVGHLGDLSIKSIFPIPQMQSNNARSMYGGLILNALTAIGVMLWRTENVFIQLIGFESALYLILYLTLGSVLPEPNRNSKVAKDFAFDDIPNNKAVIAISLAILFYLWMSPYYISVIQSRWSAFAWP